MTDRSIVGAEGDDSPMTPEEIADIESEAAALFEMGSNYCGNCGSRLPAEAIPKCGQCGAPIPR